MTINSRLLLDCQTLSITRSCCATGTSFRSVYALFLLHTFRGYNCPQWPLDRTHWLLENSIDLPCAIIRVLSDAAANGCWCGVCRAHREPTDATLSRAESSAYNKKHTPRVNWTGPGSSRAYTNALRPAAE